MEIRHSVVAGHFYESQPEVLKKQIASCFLHKLGPGKMPKQERKKQKTIATIVPHAGYMFSGPCASHAYYELSKYDLGTAIILGTNHTGISNFLFSLSLKDFETPLGIIRNNKKLSSEIIKKCGAREDESAHVHEHSIEVQLPFLQFIYKNVKIVPIVVSAQNYDVCKKFAIELSKVVKNKEKIAVIASSDFTHYGYNYGFLPFPPDKNLSEKLKNFDALAINKILQLDSRAFYENAREKTICGLASITVLIEISKILGKKAKLLKYYTSAEIIKNSNAVGYASIIFE